MTSIYGGKWVVPLLVGSVEDGKWYLVTYGCFMYCDGGDVAKCKSPLNDEGMSKQRNKLDDVKALEFLLSKHLKVEPLKDDKVINVNFSGWCKNRSGAIKVGEDLCYSYETGRIRYLKLSEVRSDKVFFEYFMLKPAVSGSPADEDYSFGEVVVNVSKQ